MALRVEELIQGAEDRSPSTPYSEQRAKLILSGFEADNADDRAHLSAWLRSLGVTREQLRSLLARPPRRREVFTELDSDLTWLEGACSAAIPGAACTETPTNPYGILASVSAPFVEAARREATVHLHDSDLNHDDKRWRATTLRVIMKAPPWRTLRLAALPLANEIGIAALDAGTDVQAAVVTVVDGTCACPDGRLKFYSSYPALARLTARRFRQWAAFSAELVERLACDRAGLADWLGVSDLRVTAVSDALGDEHDGRTVVALDTTGGRIVYKPRSIDMQQALESLALELEKLPGCPRPIFRVAETFARRGYGWTKWVRHAPITSDDDARGYYARLGQLLAAAWLFNATDLHMDNIVAAGDVPWVVDTETFLTPRLDGIRWGSYAYGESVAGIGILPLLARGSPNGAVADVSALGAERGRGEDPVSAFFSLFPRFVPVPRTDLAAPSVPASAHGYVLERDRWYDPLLEGFVTALDFVLANRTALVQNGLLSRTLDHLQVRVLLRDTDEYGLLLADALHPDMLCDGVMRQRHMEAMRRSCRERPHMVKLVNDEIRALCDGDVPAFATWSDSQEVTCTSGGPVQSMFVEAGLAVALRRIGELDRLTIDRLAWGVRAGLGCRALNVNGGKTMRAQPSTASAASTELTDLAEAALRIGRRLLSLSYDRHDPQWLDVHTADGVRWAPNVGSRYLYAGRAGYALFFAELARVTAAADIVDARDRLIDSWLRDIGGPPNPLIGAFDGAAGELYVAVRLCSLLPALRARFPVEQFIEAVEGLIDEPAQPFDLVGGLAGAALVIQQTRGVRSTGWTDDTTRRLAYRLLESSRTTARGVGWPLDTGEWPVTAAHGTAGIEYVLRLSAAAVPDVGATLAQVADQAWRWQQANYVSSAGNWRDLRPAGHGMRAQFSTSWCNGSAGIGLYRVLCASLVDGACGARREMLREFETALSMSLRRGVGYGHTLCHGDLSVAELCLTAGHVLVRPDLIWKARQIACGVAHWALRHHGCTDAGYPYILDLPGFMSGAAGIGYELLRIADPERVPSPLIGLDHPHPPAA